MKICDATGLECPMVNVPNAVLCDISKDEIKEHLIKSIGKENKIMVAGNTACMYELSTYVNRNWGNDGKDVQPVCCPMKNGIRWIFLIDRDMVRNSYVFSSLSDFEINSVLVCEFQRKIGNKCTVQIVGLEKKYSFDKVRELINEYF